VTNLSRDQKSPRQIDAQQQLDLRPHAEFFIGLSDLWYRDKEVCMDS